MNSTSPDQLLSDFDANDVTKLLPLTKTGEDLAPTTTASLDPGAVPARSGTAPHQLHDCVRGRPCRRAASPLRGVDVAEST